MTEARQTFSIPIGPRPDLTRIPVLSVPNVLSTFQLIWKLFDIYRTFFRGLGENLFF